MEKGKPTMKDVSREAGVALGTVSRSEEHRLNSSHP